MHPLTDLFRSPKDGRIELSEEAPAPFSTVKEALAAATLLIHFDPEISFSIVTDVSDMAIGSVLQ